VSFSGKHSELTDLDLEVRRRVFYVKCPRAIATKNV
jgi:hypothetical protein